MFEREIKFIYDFNLNKVKKTGSFLTYEQLLAADLHPAIMQYISAEIDYLIFEDRQKMLKNSVFDYSGGKITHYFKLISQEVKKSKRFSTEYISKLILHASSFTVNYLIRPKWSLLKFIFDDEEHKSAVEIKQILNYLYYYGYLKNVLISYLDKKKILSMNKDEFAELLNKIEKLGIETYLDDVLNTALKSMAEFFNIGTTQKTKVPLPGIHIFLKEKKLTDHINRLNNYFGEDEKINQEIQDVQKVILSLKTKQSDLFEEINEDEIEDRQTKLDEEVIEYPEEELFNSKKNENKTPVTPSNETVEDEQNVTVEENKPESVEEHVHEENIESEVETVAEDEEPELVENVSEEPVQEVNSEDKPKVAVSDEKFKIAEDKIGEPFREDNTQNLSMDVPEVEPADQVNEEEDFVIEEDSSAEINESIEESVVAETLESHETGEEENLIIVDEQEVIDEDETQPLEEILEETNEPETEKDIEAEIEDDVETQTEEDLEIEAEENVENEIIEEDLEIHEEKDTETEAEDFQIETEETIEEESYEPEIQDELPQNEELIGEESIEEESPVIDSAGEETQEDEPTLFGDKEVENEEEAEVRENDELQKPALKDEELNGATLIDMSEILENKNMTKIIENIFDYDMEDFANTIDLISECPSKAEALVLINELFENNNIKPNSKEAETFKSIISEYFDKAQ